MAMREMAREMTRKKFGGHNVLKAKNKQYYPENMMREYIRLVNAYMHIIKQVIEKYMPRIAQTANSPPELRKDAKEDIDIEGLLVVVRQAFFDANNDASKQADSFGLFKKLEQLARQTSFKSIKDWRRLVKSTLGVDIFEDYYRGDFLGDAVKRWTESNVDLIKSIPKAALGKMQTIVEEGYRSGKSTTSIMHDVQVEYSVERSRARLIARDQMAKLNADITESQQRDAGVEKYTWSTSGDSRVRDRHRQLNGKVFSWNEPPIVDERTGRRAHPGQDYQCRCVALPIFNAETLVLPINGKKEGDKNG